MMTNPLTIRAAQERFLLLDAIHRADAAGLTASKIFAGAPVELGIEAMAQAAAYHVRFRAEFSCHAFLLKIRTCRLPETETLSGVADIQAERDGEAGSSFAYRVKLSLDGAEALTGELLIGSVPYDEIFRRDILEEHYRRAFARLTQP